MSELGKRLRSIRAHAIAKGLRLMSLDKINSELGKDISDESWMEGSAPRTNALMAEDRRFDIEEMYKLCRTLELELEQAKYFSDLALKQSKEDNMRYEHAYQCALEAEKDAFRYRYLRYYFVTAEHLHGPHEGKLCLSGSMQGLDELIDTAIAAEMKS